MNIVMVCRLYTPHIGGVEKHVAGISKEAVHDGHRVDVFTLRHDRKLPNVEVIDGVKVHRVTSMHSKYAERVVLWSWMLWHIKAFILADVIQIHDVFYWYWPLRIILPWKKVYITYHGFEAGGLPTTKAVQTRQMIQRWTNGSMAVGAWIEKWYGTKPDVVTYGAGECSSKTNDSRLRLPTGQAGSNSKHIKAVFIGRISEDTGAKVYEKVIGSLEDVSLDIYGEGSKLGAVADSCVVFPKYDVACVSSYLAIIEAMQSKTLVVAYATNELKYDYLMAHPRVEDMVVVRSEKALHEFFQSYNEHEYAERINDAYDWARQQTWNRVYQKYLTLWNTL